MSKKKDPSEPSRPVNQNIDAGFSLYLQEDPFQYNLGQFFPDIYRSQNMSEHSACDYDHYSVENLYIACQIHAHNLCGN